MPNKSRRIIPRGRLASTPVDAVADLLVALVQIRLNNDRVASVGVIVLENDDPAPDLDLDRGTFQCEYRDRTLRLGGQDGPDGPDALSRMS